MRINTDGVLLGALAEHDYSARILDIGTGTGVIALMLAQRYTYAHIDAIEIDEPAAQAAAKNFRQSPFANRLHAEHIDFEAFNPAKPYDMIVSNPPFFINDLKNTDLRKGIARHAHPSFFDNLLARAASMLADNGALWLIIPPDRAAILSANAHVAGLSLIHKIELHSFNDSNAFREIVCFSKTASELQLQSVIIYDTPGVHSFAYKNLLKDFFLLF